MAGMRAVEVNFFQPGHIHQAGFGAHGHIFGIGVFRVRPSGSHAAPVFEFGTQGKVAVGKRRESPGGSHSKILSR